MTAPRLPDGTDPDAPDGQAAAPDPVDTALADLDPDQREAARRGLDRPDGPGPLLILAGAGTGKTTTLAARVAALVLAGADPNRLLLLTFTRRAAQELRDRAANRLRRAIGLPGDRPPPALPWAGTFHSVAARLLRQHAEAIGLPPDFDVLDRADAEALLGLQREALGLAGRSRRAPTAATALAILGCATARGEPLRAVVGAHFPWHLGWEDDLARLFDAYAAEKRRQRALDLDDLLLVWADAMSDPPIARAIASRFDHVLVDEMQDTNALQASLLAALRPDGRGLTMVGDDRQAIYGFRAADPAHLRGFATARHPPAEVAALARNHRSTQAILDTANAVIAAAPDVLGPPLCAAGDRGARPWLVTVEDEAGQARWVADQVLRWREEGLPLRRQAVLFRTGGHASALELELTRRGIPFVKHGGLRFLESAHVRDLLAVLRWAHNPRARLAGFRVLQAMAGIGPAQARRLLDTLDTAPDPLAAIHAWQPPVAARETWLAWRTLLANLTPGRWPDDVVHATDWLAPLLRQRHDDAEVRLKDLAQLAALAAGHADRARFLAEIAIDPPSATSDEAGVPSRDEDWLSLSTIHSAKGREWSAVAVLNLVDGCLPADLATGSPDAIEEERRLLYVAVTRARRSLALVVPQRFHVEAQPRFGDRHVWGGPSRFLTPAVLETLDRWTPDVAALPPRPVDGPAPAPPPPSPPTARDPWGAAGRRWRGPGPVTLRTPEERPDEADPR